MKNIFRHSRAFVEKHLPSLKLWRAKHRSHHHLIIALFVVLVAGTSGVYLYKKFASAATFTFTQSSWAGGATANTAVHPTNQSAWNQYTSATGVTAGATVSLPVSSYTATDDGSLSTTGSATGGGWAIAGTKADYAVGASPRDVAFDPVTNSIWVSNYGGGSGNTVSKVNISTGTKTDYAVRTGPRGIAFDSVTNSVWVAHAYSDFVSKVNISTGARTDYPVPAGAISRGIAFDSVTNSVWVVNNFLNTVSKVDILTGTRTDYATGAGPRGIAFDPVTSSVWVSNEGTGSGGTISKINITTGAKTDYAIGWTPIDVAFDSVTNSVWVANYGSNTVSKVNISTGTRTDYSTGTGPAGVAFDLVTNSVWVANDTSNTVSKVNISTGTKTDYAVGTGPNGATFDPVTNSVWVVNKTSNTVSKVAIRDSGTTSNTLISGSGTGASVGLSAVVSVDGGTGADGAYSCAGICNLAGATYNYTTFNISSGATVNVTGATALIIKTTGAVTISGSLNLNGGENVGGAGGYNGGVAGTQSSIAASGGGPGGGYGASAYSSQRGGGGSSGGSGGSPTQPSYNTANVGGSGGGGGGGNATDSGTNGAGGGGSVSVSAQGSISVAVGASIEANGGQALPSSGSAGGGGSGGGGRISLISATTITNSGSITANGGNSGGGTYTTGQAGGGGGGGVIILQDLDGVISGSSPSVPSGGAGSASGSGPAGSAGILSISSVSSTYNSSGTFESATIDLGGAATLSTLSATPTTQPAGTGVQFQVATNNDNATWNYTDLNQETYPAGVTIHTSYIRPTGQCTGYSPCYSSLSAWEAAQNRNLVASNEIEIAQIGGSWTSPDTTAVTIDGWTTDATHYIKVYTTAEARHNGKWNTGKYRLEYTPTTTFMSALSVQEDYVKVSGLQISTTYAYGSSRGFNVENLTVGSNLIEVNNNIIKGVTATASVLGVGFYFQTATNIIRFWDNIIYGFKDANNSAGTGVSVNGTSDSTNFVAYNNTVYGNYRGFSDGYHGGVLKNNISYDNTDNYYGVFASTNSYNLSGPSQTDAPGSNPRNATTVVFVDAVNADFHLSSSDTGAKNTGVDLSADANLPVTTDIEGHIRPTGAGVVDIGAHEYAATGGNIPASLSGSRYIRYKAYLSTADTAYTPTLDSLTLNYAQYTLSGDLISSKYDSGSAGNVIGNISWVASGTDATNIVKFQLRTASTAGGLDTAPWCGQSSCSGSTYFTTSGTSNATLSAATGDHQWFQYRAFLTGGGVATPTITSVTVQYVVNAPPAVGNVLPAQITDSASADYGKVSFSFEASDQDTSSGSPANQFKVTPSLYEYSTNGGGAWTTISSGLGANAYSVITLTADSATTTTTVVWTPTAGIALTGNAKIRVTISDGEAANYSATATSGAFTLDTTAPVIASTGGFLVDSSVGGAGLAGIKLTATDDSTVQYRLCNNSDFSADGLNSGAGKCAEWTTLATSSVSLATSTTSWNTTLTASSTEVVFVQVRDTYGNVTARTATAPAMPGSFLAADVSNPTADSYGETLSWLSVANASSYKVYYATTTSSAVAPSSYTFLTNSASNVYTHSINTATSSAYWYRVVALNANGDTSNFTAEMTNGDVPDSFGATIADTTAPDIRNLQVVSADTKSTSAHITFNTFLDSSPSAILDLATSTIQYSKQSYNNFASSTVSTLFVSTHSVYLTDLEPNTTYVYRAKVSDVLGNVTQTAVVGTPFTTASGPVITNVTEREITNNSAIIFWNTSTSSTSYVQHATTQGGVSGATPPTGSATMVPVSDTPGIYQHQVGLTGLVTAQTYYFQVTSTDSAGNGTTDTNNGQYYSFVTLRDTSPPVISATSTPVLAPNSAVVVWQTDEPASTKVEYGLTNSYGTTSEDVSDPLSIYHVRALTSLTKETPYYYRVTSKDAANNTATATGTFTTPDDGNVTITMVNVRSSAEGEVKDTTAPSISNVTVSDITPFGAVVKFDTSEVAVSFVDYGKDTSYGDSAGDKVYGTTHAVKLRGLALGTEYHINVTAHDKAGNTGTGSDQTFKTTFLSENLKDMTKIENIEQFQKEIEDTIESILPSLVPPFVSKPVVTDITESGATVSFKTNIKSFPVVGFIEDALYDGAKENPYTGEVSDTTEKAVDHTVDLIGLKQNTKYHLQARAFSLPKVIGKSADISFTTKASKISGSIIERKKDSFTVVWTTDEPTSSIVEYKNVRTGITERKTDDAKRTAHSMKIDNLPPGTTYAVDISGLNEQGNVVEAGDSLTVTTSRDVTPPVISGFKVDNALVPGRTDRIQTIVSWKTDEPANSTTYYEEGTGTIGDTRELSRKNEVLDSYVTAHSVILPSLKPGTIYRLKVTSSDDSGNEASFGPRTVITPRQTESITDIIFKNFEDSFKFLRDI